MIGVVYHPSAAGCRIWRDWDPEVIDADLRRIAEAGLNLVRVFVFWRDVEQAEGVHDETVLGRVREFVRLAGTHGLECVLSVCTIWMNGQRLDLPWRRGRSLWRDPDMLDRGEQYVRAVAGALTGLSNVYAIDLGDEIANVDPAEAAALRAEDVIAWQSRLARAIREILPSAKVSQANDVSGVLGTSVFGPDASEGLDLLCVHGWPLWSPGNIESNASYKASQLPGFLVRYARAYGPVLLDEIGSYGVSEQVATGYLRAGVAAAIGAGAEGVIAWCWQDISSETEPYQLRPGERRVGLTALDGTPKPRLAAMRDALALEDFRPDPADTGLYVPELARQPSTSYIDGEATNVAAFYAHLLLQRAHIPYEVCTARSARDYRLVIVPSVARLTLADRELLTGLAERGATVYLSVADHVHGWPDEDVAGARPADFSLLTGGVAELIWDDETWPVPLDGLGRRRIVVEPVKADVIATFADGTPACTLNQVGTGQVIVCAVPFELLLDRPGRLAETAWHGFYRRIAGLAGLRPPELAPEVEMITGGPFTLLIDHAAKGWTLLRDGRVVYGCG
ncbi:beta-galactosidase trimerization domain-containing protein [Actinocrispum sp. NPDC049592]|uniref:beta-galactosidase trimerization domain-containing protein n=1 Tax=Actinocrispum sp. NPDC049592 TaxID=3154835 RepID=UPI0034173EC0